MKVLDTEIRKDEKGFYTIKLDVNHEELEILVDALNERIHKGFGNEEQARNDCVALYGKITHFWENTSSSPVAIDPSLVKIPDEVCPENSHWQTVKAGVGKCVANAGYFEAEDGTFKPLPSNDCGANAHFDAEKGCICDNGFIRDKLTGLCVPAPIEPPPK